MENYELYHHGILGMHWGIRRYQNPDGTLTDAGKRRLKTKEIKNDVRNRSLLSDDDLTTKINRLERERKFRDIANLNYKGDKKLTGFVEKLGSNTIDRIANTAAIGLGSYVVYRLLVGEKLDKKTLANVITGNKFSFKND